MVLACAVSPVLSHDWTLTTMGMLIGPDGTYQMDLYCDFDALLLGLDPGHLDDELWMALVQMDPGERRRRVGALKEHLEQWVVIRVDGQKSRASIEFPEIRDGAGVSDPRALLPGSIARFRGRAPEGATSFTLELHPRFGPVMAGFRRGGDPRLEERLLAAGIETEPIPIHGSTGWRGALSVPLGCLGLGFRHVLPGGLEHALFVVGLCLLNIRLRTVAAQIGVFVLAHTVALALSVYGLLSLPGEIVEPLMTLAIAYVALENVFSSEMKPWRSAVVFGVGLLHGLASSGVILDLGLSPTAYGVALLTLNLGLGLAMVAVAGLILLVTVRFGSRDGYREWFAVPASLLLAVAGLLWTFVRLFVP
jgi:hypothetical protein